MGPTGQGAPTDFPGDSALRRYACRATVDVPGSTSSWLARIEAGWVYGVLPVAVVLLIDAPLLGASWTALQLATYLHLPAYLVHQYEEHDRDRFRRFFNATLGGGFEVLSPRAVFITNVVVVWGLLTLALYAAVHLGPGGALVAAYLVLANAAVHVVHAVYFRGYNPGLITALVVFVPLGSWTVSAASSTQASAAAHALGLGTAVAVHALIIVHVRRRRAILERVPPPPAGG